MRSGPISIVNGRRMVSFDIAEHDERTLDVVVREDHRTWKFVEPSWRGISFGTAGELVYWWSARRFAVLTPDREVNTHDLHGDEIMWVFRVDEMWILICELTVRLMDDVRELSQLGFQDVIIDARWDREVLALEIMGFPEKRVRVKDRRLLLADSIG